MENNQKAPIPPPKQKKSIWRAWLDSRPKKIKYTIKVMDFTIWNGLKFGLGIFFGIALGFLLSGLFVKILEIFVAGLVFSKKIPL